MERLEIMAWLTGLVVGAVAGFLVLRGPGTPPAAAHPTYGESDFASSEPMPRRVVDTVDDNYFDEDEGVGA